MPNYEKDWLKVKTMFPTHVELFKTDSDYDVLFYLFTVLCWLTIRYHSMVVVNVFHLFAGASLWTVTIKMALR